MSEISRELQEQQGDVGAVMRKLFPEAPSLKPSVTDTNQAERRAYEAAAAAGRPDDPRSVRMTCARVVH